MKKVNSLEIQMDTLYNKFKNGNLINYIYYFVNSKHEVIYVGKAFNLSKRLRSHNHLSEECYNELDYILCRPMQYKINIDEFEKYMIQKIKPKYNKVHNDKTTENIPLPEYDKIQMFPINKHAYYRILENTVNIENDFLNSNHEITCYYTDIERSLRKYVNELNIKYTNFYFKISIWDGLRDCINSFGIDGGNILLKNIEMKTYDKNKNKIFTVKIKLIPSKQKDGNK